MAAQDYDLGLERNAANHQPLTPLGFLERAALVDPDRVAVVHAGTSLTYRDFAARCHRLGSALAARGIGRGDTVAALLPNIPAMLECHFGVPMLGAVLNAINTRLDAPTIAYILDHGEAKAIIVDRELIPLLEAALAESSHRPEIVEVTDAALPESARGNTLGGIDYEDLLAGGDPAFVPPGIGDEWDAIALNYTSGTTGRPKGVVYHHRGAYLSAFGNVLAGDMTKHPVYLWTLPMFHCNGWCFPWTITALRGTHVCLRAVRGAAMWDAIADHGVTHMCGAPIIMATLLDTPAAQKRTPRQVVNFLTAAAPPPEAVLSAMLSAGFHVTHIYGLTEVYGPSTVNEWHVEWNARPMSERAALMARQGVRYIALEALDVLDPATMQPVPADGTTLGEVMFRGNLVSKGYFKDRKATDAAFRDGWFHSGDLAVKYPDGYMQLKDRAKDIIISGGENISSIEVEDTLYKHPAVALAAVVAMPDPKWGEVPCAFIELKPGQDAAEADLIAFCREHLAGFKTPKRIRFEDLPKTSTGKIQKAPLRQRAKED
jgi:fatty-acyl-CoA synthase